MTGYPAQKVELGIGRLVRVTALAVMKVATEHPTNGAGMNRAAR
jgi:hypothetical protein